MKIIFFCLNILFIAVLTACSPVTSSITNQYKLSAFGLGTVARHATHKTILVYPPEAVAGFQTEQMLYTEKPYEISAFANNAWANPPAAMLLPLITLSIEKSGYFHAVTSTTNSEHTDYRLDTQLLELKQNFLKRPSQIDLSIKVVLSDLNSNRPLRSKIMHYHVVCPSDNPYGGVLAANNAVTQFTTQLSNFLARQVARE